MTELRRSTVYDYSDLRLHPDGTRVHQMDQNLRPKAAQITVQTARSNWIARDAAGFGTVPKHRTKRTVRMEEDISVTEEADPNKDGNTSGGAESEPTELSRKRRPPDHHKANFRRNFLKDEEYLIAEVSTEIPTGNPVSESGESCLQHPSPDLLKCIHRFACEFYTERGQLLNSSKLYRQERKARKEKRRSRIHKEDRRDSSPLSSSSNDSQSGDEEQEGEDDAFQDTTETRRGAKKKRSGKKGRRLIGDLHTDMYKVFDGSALMALGMLVQEHIAHLLTPRIPDTWESEVRSAYTEPWSESQPLHKGHTREGGPSTEEVTQALEKADSGEPDSDDDTTQFSSEDDSG